MYHTQVLLDSMLVTTSDIGGSSSTVGSMVSPLLGVRMLYPLLVTDRGRQVATLRIIITLLQYQVLALQAYGYIQTNNATIGTITNNNVGGSAFVGGGSFVLEKNTNLALITTSTYTQAKVDRVIVPILCTSLNSLLPIGNSRCHLVLLHEQHEYYVIRVVAGTV